MIGSGYFQFQNAGFLPGVILRDFSSEGSGVHDAPRPCRTRVSRQMLRELSMTPPDLTGATQT